MNVNNIINTLETIAPLKYAASWDNVGLLVGSGEWPADSILLTIDLTKEVLEEAIEAKTNLIIAYHPPIFEPLMAVTDACEKQAIVLEAIRAGIAIYSPHTALDSAPGGVNDWLVEGMGEGESTSLEVHAEISAGEQSKIITMCPPDACEAIHQAMSNAGGGVIGNYEQCSFRMVGTGTFFGTGEANPATGEKGRLELVEEIRLEMVCSDAKLMSVIDALREAHPYEEPPIEIYRLSARPDAHIGQGRRLNLNTPVSLDEIINRIKAQMGVEHLKVALGRNAPVYYQTIGLCAGAGGSLLDSAIESGCELFFTGEMRHHAATDAMARGCTIILVGHTNTERGYLSVLQQKITDLLDDVSVVISTVDRAQFEMR